MIIGTKELLKLVEEKNLLENLDERETTNPEGAGFDLRLGAIYKISGEPFLRRETRTLGEMEKIFEFEPENNENNFFTLEPGEYYIFETYEKYNMPDGMFSMIVPRSTLFMHGVMMDRAFVPPGYSGKIKLGVFNAGKLKFRIEGGARFCHVTFAAIEGEVVSRYRGQWQGNRITSGETEIQI